MKYLILQLIYHKKSKGGDPDTPAVTTNQQLADELYKPITKIFDKSKVICDRADIQLISRYNKGIYV